MVRNDNGLDEQDDPDARQDAELAVQNVEPVEDEDSSERVS